MRPDEANPEQQGDVIETAQALLRQGKNDEAIGILSAQRANSDRALKYLADAYFQKRDWTNALSCTREAISRHLDLEYNRIVEIKILSNAKCYAEALELADQYESNHGGHIDVLGIKKVANFYLGRFIEAQRCGQLEIQLKAQISEKSTQHYLKLIPGRGNRKVVAYSLWGNRECYNLGAIINAELIGRTFPGWQSRCHPLPGEASPEAEEPRDWRGSRQLGDSQTSRWNCSCHPSILWPAALERTWPPPPR